MRLGKFYLCFYEGGGERGIEELQAKDLGAAIKEAVKYLEDEDGGMGFYDWGAEPTDGAVMQVVAPLDIAAIETRIMAREAARTAAITEAEERQQLEKLKKKYEGK